MCIIKADVYSSMSTAVWELFNEGFMILIRLQQIFLLVVSMPLEKVWNIAQHAYS